MNKEKARQILTQSITNLEKRNNGITQGDIEAEVINNACLAIIKNQNEKIGRGNSIKEIILGALNSTEDYYPIAKAFIHAAQELLPEYFTDEDAELAMLGIEQNLAWEGMWEFLIDYFQKHHGITITDNESTPLFFFSARQEKYEFGILTSDTDSEKTVSIIFSNDYKEVVVDIESDLPVIKGYLINKENNRLKYRNKELNYVFTITFDDFEDVESFVVEMVDQNSEVIYFE